MEDSRLQLANQLAKKVIGPFEIQWTWPRPIPISERLPEVDGEHLLFAAHVHGGGGDWVLAQFARGWFWETDVNGELYYELDRNYHTHWLPLPPNP